MAGEIDKDRARELVRARERLREMIVCDDGVALSEETWAALIEQIVIASNQTGAEADGILAAIEAMLPMLIGEEVRKLDPQVVAEMLVHGVMMSLGRIKQ